MNAETEGGRDPEVSDSGLTERQRQRKSWAPSDNPRRPFLRGPRPQAAEQR